MDIDLSLAESRRGLFCRITPPLGSRPESVRYPITNPHGPRSKAASGVRINRAISQAANTRPVNIRFACDSSFAVLAPDWRRSRPPAHPRNKLPARVDTAEGAFSARACSPGDGSSSAASGRAIPRDDVRADTLARARLFCRQSHQRVGWKLFIPSI
jgi:hypothetical protein